MVKNYLRVALRNLRKHFGYAFINITGLAVGIACCIFIVLYVQDELSYDRFHAQADRIYRVVLDGRISGSDLNAPVSPAPMARTLVEDFPEVLKATRIFGFIGSQMIRQGDLAFIEDNVLFVDSTFFDVFTFPLLRGNPETALQAPNTIVLTESMARKYFGTEDPMGQNLIMGDTTRFEVTGLIADVPPNSHVDFGFLASLNTLPQSGNDQWISNNFFTYLVLTEGYDPAELEAKLPEFFQRYAGPQLYEAMGIQYEEFLSGGNRIDYHLQALTDIHLHSHLRFELGANGDIAYVYLFSAIAFFILLIACINFMNLATARSTRRAREVGMRKALGSTRAQLIRQFLGESTLLGGLAMLLALGLVVLLLPAFNTLAGKALSASFLLSPLVWAGFIGLALFVGLIAGSYPAFYLSAFRPSAVLKASLETGSTRSWLRNGLVIFQFAISIGLIAGTLIVRDQLSFVRTKTLGFNKDHVVVIERANLLGPQSDAFKDALRTHTGIAAVGGATSVPGGLIGATAFQPEGIASNEAKIMAPLFVDHDFIDALGIEMAAGRAFSRDFPSDSAAFLINEAALPTLGWTEAVGKKLTMLNNPPNNFSGEVVGVVKDYHYASLHQEIGALAIRLGTFPMPNLVVRVSPDDLPGTLAFIEQQWQEFVPDQPFDYSFLDQTFNALYQADQQLSTIITTFALFAILIACLGLFGLAAFMAEQRRKEIGVRKALGASVPQILLLLSQDFTKLVLIAFVVAAPAAFFAMRGWLQNFAYHTEISPWIFLLAGVLALLIAWLTVSYQSVKAALTDPVKSLRHE